MQYPASLHGPRKDLNYSSQAHPASAMLAAIYSRSWDIMIVFKHLAALLLCATFAAAPPALANSALLPAIEINKAVNTVEALHKQLVNLMLSGEQDLSVRKEMISDTLVKSFDLPAMTRAIIGSRVWRDLSPEQHNNAEAAFSNWMITQYASRFSTSSDPEFLTRETRDGGLETVVVETQLRTKKRVVGLDYRMRANADDFKIIDVFLDGRVSEVALRKSEFRAAIKEDGIEGFLKAVTAKTKSLESAQ